MKYIISGFIGTLVVYTFITFVVMDANLFTWHWTARLIFAVFSLFWGGYLVGLQQKENVQSD